MGKESIKLVANNKKAYHDYFIEDKYETGIELFGTEVKSIRMGKCSIKEAFVRIDKGEVYIYGMHINPYEKGNIFNKDPLRVRKLLLHKSEINRMASKVKEKGFTLVPLQVYFKGSLVKVEIGLARGKKLYDKRDDIAKKDQRRETEREFKQTFREAWIRNRERGSHMAAVLTESLIYEILSVVEEIPKGKVASYGQIAELIGRSRNARLVGKVLSMADYYGTYPCHRVVNHCGRLAPFFREQKNLLLKEHVEFKDDNHVNMKTCRWDLK